MNQLKSKIAMLIIAATLFSCKGGSGGSKKGADLKGEDALSYLMGKEKRYWQLEEGHDYYDMLQFEKDGKGGGTNGIAYTYSVKDNKIFIKDFLETEFKIVEISNDKLILNNRDNETLTYLHIEPGSKLAKEKPFLSVNPKWLNGKYGTSWKFSEGGKIYSYMNDGNIIEATSLRKIATWKVEGNKLYFGSNTCTINRLSPVFFDYDAMGIPVQMNYLGEANADGTVMQKK